MEYIPDHPDIKAAILYGTPVKRSHDRISLAHGRFLGAEAIQYRDGIRSGEMKLGCVREKPSGVGHEQRYIIP